LFEDLWDRDARQASAGKFLALVRWSTGGGLL